MPLKQPSFRPSVLVLGALGLALTGACKDDPPTPKLFEEEGAWSVIRYDLDGTTGLVDINNANRRDAFMLSFDSHIRVVTTAACVEREGDTVADSSCLLNPSDTFWDCQCFAYDYVNDEMLWREFNPGDIPPDVSLAAADEPGDGTTGGGGGGGDDTLITLSEIPDINSTYNFRPLPDGVFGSDGVVSRFIFQKRSPSVFGRAYEDPDGRPGCEPCVP